RRRKFPKVLSCGSWHEGHCTSPFLSSVTGGAMDSGAASSCPPPVSDVAYAKLMGWSSERSGPRAGGPGGIRAAPAMEMGPCRLRTLPSAMVPSWQERQSLEAPVGWPGLALSELDW